MTEAWRQDELVRPAGGGAATGPEAFKADPVLPNYPKLPIDYNTGGSLKAHMAASLVNDNDRLAVIQQFHPGAHVMNRGLPEGVQKGGMPRPSTKPDPVIVFPDDVEHPTKLIAFTPRGMNLSDIADLSGQALRFVGMAGGGAAGEATPVPGGGIAGMALGDVAMGELGNYLAGKWAGVPDTRSTGQRIAEAGLTAGTDVALGTAGAVAGSAGAYGIRAAGNKGFGIPVLKEMSRTAKFDAAGAGRQDVADALTRLGVDPDATAPLITESRTVQNLVDAASRFPRAADRWGAAMARFRDTLQAAWERSLNELGSSETEQAAAGAKAQKGILDWAKGKSVRQEMLEDQVERDIGAKNLVPASGLQGHIDDMLARATGPDGKPLKSAGQVVPGFLGQVKADLEANGGQLPFGYLRDLKTAWDAKADWGQAGVEGMPKQFRDAANAARHDLAVAAQQRGGAAASNWQEAMANWSERQDRMELLGRLANHPQAERAFQSLTAGDRAGPTLLNAYKRTVETTAPGAWEDVAAVRLQQQALDKSGRIDPVKFEGIWGQGPKAYPDSVKNLLAPPGSPLRQQWDDLALIGQRMRETKFDVEGSPTARRMEAMRGAAEGAPGVAVRAISKSLATVQDVPGAIKDFFGDVGALTAGLRADQQMKLYQSPEFRKWLIDGQRTPPRDPGGLGAHVGRLVGIANSTPGLRAPLLKLANDIQQHFGGAGGGPGEEQPQGTQVEPGPPPTPLDRVKQGAQAAGLAPRPSAQRGNLTMGAPRG